MHWTIEEDNHHNDPNQRVDVDSLTGLWFVKEREREKLWEATQPHVPTCWGPEMTTIPRTPMHLLSLCIPLSFSPKPTHHIFMIAYKPKSHYLHKRRFAVLSDGDKNNPQIEEDQTSLLGSFLSWGECRLGPRPIVFYLWLHMCQRVSSDQASFPSIVASILVSIRQSFSQLPRISGSPGGLCFKFISHFPHHFMCYN